MKDAPHRLPDLYEPEAPMPARVTPVEPEVVGSDMDGLRRMASELWGEFRDSRNPYVRFVRFPLKAVKYAGIAAIILLLGYSRYVLILLLLVFGFFFISFIAYKIWT
jgi:hypothetical protein